MKFKVSKLPEGWDPRGIRTWLVTGPPGTYYAQSWQDAMDYLFGVRVVVRVGVLQ